MIMPGRNTLVLCAEALRAIVERHLNETQRKSDDPKIRVTLADINEEGDNVLFHVTTGVAEGEGK